MYNGSGNTVSHAVVIRGAICTGIFSATGTAAGNRGSGIGTAANMAPAVGNIYGEYRNYGDVIDGTAVIREACTGGGQVGCGLCGRATGATPPLAMM